MASMRAFTAAALDPATALKASPQTGISGPVDRHIASVDDASYQLARKRSAVAPGGPSGPVGHCAGVRPEAVPRVRSMTAGTVGSEQLTSEIIGPVEGCCSRSIYVTRLAMRSRTLASDSNTRNIGPHTGISVVPCAQSGRAVPDELADGVARKCVVASRAQREVGGPRAQLGGNRAAAPSIAPMTCGAVGSNESRPASESMRTRGACGDCAPVVTDQHDNTNTVAALW